MVWRSLLGIVAYVGLLGNAEPVHADDVGIDKARLVQESKGQYLLEVDSTPRWAGAYARPILPARFEHIGRPERERRSGALTVRFRFRTAEEGLNGDDELLLPWNRAGVALTAQWSDGSIHQALLLRDIEGIHIPIRLLRPVEQRPLEVVQQHFLVGLVHAASSVSHWVFVFGLCLIAKGRQLLRMLLLFAGGQGLSLILVDLGLPNMPLPTVEAGLAVAALLSARAAWLKFHVAAHFDAILLALGTLHGMGYAGSLVRFGESSTQQLPALFGFNLGVDTLHVAAWMSAVGVIAILHKRAKWPQRGAAVSHFCIGSTASAVLVAAFVGGTAASHKDMNREYLELPGLSGGGDQRVAVRPRRAKGMTHPVMSFVTVEPFEVRHEVLVSGHAAKSWVQPTTQSSVIAIADQELWAAGVLSKLSDSTSVQIDGALAAPILTQCGFVTIGANGIYDRQNPTPEPVAKAVFGVVFVYETAGLAKSVTVDWDMFSETVTKIPTTTTDPFGGRQADVTVEDPRLEWESRLTGYRVPRVAEVEVIRPTIPALSIGIVAILAAVICLTKRKRKPQADCSLMLGCALAVALYPFARTPLPLPLASTFGLDPEAAVSILDDMLTNVYRSFDLRDEEAIYDRLAVSVTGDQLTEIYLDNRRSLELEDRGGARANVDEVEILNVRSVRSDSSGGFTVDATWTVSGCVSHFGHTHYRRNRYAAEVNIIPTDGVWKIQTIEVANQIREL